MTINRGLWSDDEHDRFLEAIQIYPHGPWRFVAKRVGTRNIRQVQTHAQKYYEKIGRHLRGLRKERVCVVRLEHRIDPLPAGLHRPMIIDKLGKGPFALASASASRRLHDEGEAGDYALVLEDSVDILLKWIDGEL